MPVSAIESIPCPECGSEAMVTLNLLALTDAGADRQATVSKYQCPRRCVVDDQIILAYLKLA
jgi:hypothetical protein